MPSSAARWREGGTPLVRGESAHFLSLLYPLLTAPAWLVDDVAQAYRTVQTVNAVTMSLAAIPVFLLARRLRVGDRLAVTAAALAVLLPELLYSSSVMAETLAYPLALATAAVVVAAVERPTLRLQLAVLGFSGLAALTRLQLAVLPVCYLAAVIVVGAARPAAPRDAARAPVRGRRDRARRGSRSRRGARRHGRHLRRRDRVSRRAARCGRRLRRDCAGACATRSAG